VATTSSIDLCAVYSTVAFMIPPEEAADATVLPQIEPEGSLASEAMYLRISHETRGLLSSMEALLIDEVLRYTDGNKPEAAAILGISLKTLYNKLHAKNSSQPAVSQPVQAAQTAPAVAACDLPPVSDLLPKTVINIQLAISDLSANVADYVRLILLFEVLKHAENNSALAAKIMGMDRMELLKNLQSLKADSRHAPRGFTAKVRTLRFNAKDDDAKVSA
jgi:DNA-binding protein Fis